MISDQLKEQTKSNHQSLEKKLIGKMRAMRNKQDYIDLLTIFYSYFGGLEQLIQGNVLKNKVPDYDLRRKAYSLSADIELLGGRHPALAAQHFLPAITNHAEALGAMYVIEGSTLGGKIISEMITKQLGITDGVSFFNGYGADTISMWQRFQAVLNQPENLPGDAIIAAANDTFLKFSEWFDLNA